VLLYPVATWPIESRTVRVKVLDTPAVVPRVARHHEQRGDRRRRIAGHRAGQRRIGHVGGGDRLRAHRHQLDVDRRDPVDQRSVRWQHGRGIGAGDVDRARVGSGDVAEGVVGDHGERSEEADGTTADRERQRLRRPRVTDTVAPPPIVPPTSLAAMDCAPAVFRVTLKVCVPASAAVKV